MVEQMIVLYTMEGCPYCDMMKEQLEELNIPIVIRDINIVSEEYDMFVDAVDGNESVPAFMIIESEGERNKVKFFAPERDYNTIDEGVQIINELYTPQ